MCAALMILIRIFYPSTMYRVTRLRPLPTSVSRSATRKPDFRQNSLIRRGKKQALEDYLLRCFSREIGRLSFKAKGSGKSGLIATSRPGQEVLSRTACEIGRNEITARFEVGFPAFGRTINSGELIRIFFDFLPGCVENVFFYRRQNTAEIKNALRWQTISIFIRNELKRLDLISFVADGSILPRETGVSDRPMKGSVAFHSRIP